MSDDSDDADYKPDSLVFLDDDNILIDIDSDLEDKGLRPSFPKDNRHKDIIPCGRISEGYAHNPIEVIP